MADKLDEKFDDRIDQIFDEDKLDKAIKKGKRKSTLRTVLVSIGVTLVVLLVVYIGNFLLSMKFSNDMYERTVAYVKLTVPNGYTSSTYDIFGFLGGRSDYTISRNVGGKPVVLERRVQPFGISAFNYMTRATGSGGHVGGDWPKSYWEYGYNRMMFFHPDIDYKEYKNDLELLNEIGDGRIFELALSLDRTYVISEIPAILPEANICWYWIDTYSSETLKEFAQEAEERDPKSVYIRESEALGVSVGAAYELGGRIFSSGYKDFLNHLKSLPYYLNGRPYFEEVHNELDSKGYTDPMKAPIIGVIVQGTKEELKALIGNPHIKASSFGVIIDKY